MDSNNVRPSKYTLGAYNIPELKVGSVSFNAQIEVFRQEPISRDKPTAFVAGHAYEGQLGKHPVDQVIYKAHDLGYILGKIYTVITGHCTGVPSYIARAALGNGQVIGISAYADSAQHLEEWKKTKIYTDTEFRLKPNECATIAIHTGVGVWHRDIFNVELTNNHRQQVYIVGGNEGTSHETYVSVAHHSIIGALLGIGGVSDDISTIKDYLGRHNIIYHIVEDTDPKALVQKVGELSTKLISQDKEEKLSQTPLIKLLDTLEERILEPTFSPSPSQS